MTPLARRDALRLLAAGAAAPFAVRAAFADNPAVAPAPEGDAAYGGFRMSVATYSLHKFPFDRALTEIKGFGLRYTEVNPKHIDIDGKPETIAAARQLLEAAGIRALAFGVFYTERYKDDRVKAIRDAFAIATALGMRTISCDPEPEWLGAMEEAAAKSGVRLGIHNHGPKARYDRLEPLLKTLEGRHANVGATVDVGHYIRSGEEPAAVIRALGKRVHGVHLKDVAKEGDNWKAVNIGKGVLDVKATLAALRDVGYDGALSLEYEVALDDPFAGIRECLAAVKAAAAR